MDLRRLFFRSWFYFRQGYSLYLSWPLSFIGFVSTVYYLAVQNIPFLADIFPRFHLFVITMLFTIPPLGALLGWMHYKGVLSAFFKAERDIGVEADPYSWKIANPQATIFYKVISELAKEHGVNTSKLDEIIRESEEKFRVG